MKVLITGANGQLGRSLRDCAPPPVELIALPSDILDITDVLAVDAAVREYAPQILINAAAYTKVDAAEESAELADRVNHLGVGILADASRSAGAKLIHVSTDFVFDGNSSRPYRIDAPTAPINRYGRTKIAGEAAAGFDALIVRTGWLYSAFGNNFVATMLRLMRERSELRVVDDQIGTPTSTSSLAEAIWRLAPTDCTGIFHYSDSGVASWYDFAVAIMEESLAIGLLERRVDIYPIPSNQYPTPARRPSFSVLDKSETVRALGRAPPHWRANLRAVLGAILSNE